MTETYPTAAAEVSVHPATAPLITGPARPAATTDPHPAPLERDGRTVPAWMREVDFALRTHPQILLTGNVRDIYPLPLPAPSVPSPAPSPAPPPRTTLVGLEAVLWHVCRSQGYRALATLNPVSQRLEVRTPAEAGDQAEPATLRPFMTAPVDAARLSQLLQAVVAPRQTPIAVCLPYAARIFPAGGLPEPHLLDLMAQVEALGHRAAPTGLRPPGAPAALLTPYNTIFWICERQEDLHPLFPLNSHALRVIRVPSPTLDARRNTATFAIRSTTPGTSAAATPQTPAPSASAPVAKASEALADVTHGMTTRELFDCAKLIAEQNLPPERFTEAARLLRVGVTDDPWSGAELRRKIAHAEKYLNERVIGQEAAVRKTVDILIRSAVGLNGAHLSSSPNRPRGVLFLAGPTGVGKTELAKGLASLVLGGDAEPLRFDMSEFRADEAHQRLIGAPPGYVGYDAGGELTNAVRTNPVCVLLFDEIEKAHPRIFDLFLQILEDGRLTDGRGATVHFTECFLIFTSNLGVSDTQHGGDGTESAPAVHPGMEPRQVERILRSAYEDFFNRGIGRPELRNRFGDNYVALSYLTPEAVERLVDIRLASVQASVRLRLQVNLVVDDEVREELVDQATAKITDGGRGVNNVIEAAIVNPLARHLFENPAPAGSTLTLTSLTSTADRWTLGVR